MSEQPEIQYSGPWCDTESVDIVRAIDLIYWMINGRMLPDPDSAGCSLKIMYKGKTLWKFQLISQGVQLSRDGREPDYRFDGAKDVIESFHKALEEANDG